MFKTKKGRRVWNRCFFLSSSIERSTCSRCFIKFRLFLAAWFHLLSLMAYASVRFEYINMKLATAARPIALFYHEIVLFFVWTTMIQLNLIYCVQIKRCFVQGPEYLASLTVFCNIDRDRVFKMLWTITTNYIDSLFRCF